MKHSKRMWNYLSVSNVVPPSRKLESCCFRPTFSLSFANASSRKQHRGHDVGANTQFGFGDVLQIDPPSHTVIRHKPTLWKASWWDLSLV